MKGEPDPATALLEQPGFFCVCPCAHPIGARNDAAPGALTRPISLPIRSARWSGWSQTPCRQSLPNLKRANLEYKARVRQDGSTLLHAAARAGTLEAVDSLVTAKADVRTQSEVGEAHAPHSESRVVAALANAWGGGLCCGDGEREEGTRGHCLWAGRERGERRQEKRG